MCYNVWHILHLCQSRYCPIPALEPEGICKMKMLWKMKPEQWLRSTHLHGWLLYHLDILGQSQSMSLRLHDNLRKCSSWVSHAIHFAKYSNPWSKDHSLITSLQPTCPAWPMPVATSATSKASDHVEKKLREVGFTGRFSGLGQSTWTMCAVFKTLLVDD